MLVTNIKNTTIDSVIVNSKEFKLDRISSLINSGPVLIYSDLFRKLENDLVNKDKLARLNILPIKQDLESIIVKAKKAVILKNEKDWLTQNPKSYALIALAKSAFSVAIIAGGILAGAASVVFLGPIGPILATLVGATTFLTSAFLGAGYAYQGGAENIMQAEMGIILLAPITPFIPLWTYFFREKQLVKDLANFESEKAQFEKKFTEFADSINSFYPQFKKDIDNEIKALSDQQNENLELDQRLQLQNKIVTKLELLKLVETIHLGLE